jgi:hypothetical protein
MTMMMAGVIAMVVALDFDSPLAAAVAVDSEDREHLLG